MAWKEPTQELHNFLYLAIDDAIDVGLDKWLAEWRTTMDLAMGGSNSTAQKKKDETNLNMA